MNRTRGNCRLLGLCRIITKGLTVTSSKSQRERRKMYRRKTFKEVAERLLYR
jgi:hypothetical protein